MKKFTPSNIEVGQKYKHPNYPGVVYLGVGMRLADGIIFAEKRLVIISENCMLGAMYKMPETANEIKMWSKFFPIG